MTARPERSRSNCGVGHRAPASNYSGWQASYVGSKFGISAAGEARRHIHGEPTGAVTVTPSRSSGDADVTVSGALTFTAANWLVPQTVTVSAEQDGDAVNDTAEIGHSVSGADYGSVAAASVSVTVTDDEVASSGLALSVDTARPRLARRRRRRRSR